MKTYKLSHTEVWALATLVFLPIETGSILSQWLTEFSVPDIESITAGAINTLEAKSYIDPNRGADIFPEELLEAITVLAASSVRLTAAIQRNGKFTWSYFGQLEETIVQYEISGDDIQIHAPDRAYQISAMLVPNWFQVEAQEHFQETLPFGAYLMLSTAFQLSDIHAALGEEGRNPTFSRSALIDAFIESKEWVDIYFEMGIPGIQPVTQMPIKDYLDFLIQQDYLRQTSSDVIQIGHRMAGLSAVYSDPDLCTLTLSLDGIGADLPISEVLI